VSRDLTWEGCYNVRDLGGIALGPGGMTRWGAAVRADSLHKLTAAGWAALVAHGVRTVIDLRNDFEHMPDVAARPREVVTVQLPLDGFEDREFWDPIVAGPQFGTPIYYRGHLERMPERSAAVLRAIARARPGGVAFHCVGGRDRTGQITIVLLALLGAGVDQIIGDYELSDERLAPMWRANRGPDEARVNAEFLAGRNTSAAELIASLLKTLDVDAVMRAGGLDRGDTAALRARLVAQ
jgi:protein-tyrosine phosphatase